MVASTSETENKKEKMDNPVLPADYQKIFNNRVVIVTGVARSGTSILGRIVGSLTDVIYLYEPIILRLAPPMIESGLMDFESGSQLLRGILFEDYYLQLLQGRNLNFKRSDHSFIGNYQHLTTVKKRWIKYERRKEVLKDIYNGKHIFVLKINNIYSSLPMLEKIFKGLRVVHIVRNGNAVISSSVKRGWYSDEYLNHHTIRWMRQREIKIPWFISDKDIKRFYKWNRETRIAYIWRILVKMTMGYGEGKKGSSLELRYEDLVGNPERVVNICEKFLDSQKTRITAKNINVIKKHVVTRHPDQTGNIDTAERPFFTGFMNELGY